MKWTLLKFTVTVEGDRGTYTFDLNPIDLINIDDAIKLISMKTVMDKVDEKMKEYDR